MSKNIDCLVVEDSPSQALQLQMLLEEHGYVVEVAGDGQIALAMLETVRPTVIISDIVMPVMNGYELCRAVKCNPRLRNIMVMLLTYLSDAEDIFRALECGADNFVTKPFDHEQLLTRVDYLIANRRVRDEEVMAAGLEVNFGGQRQFITSSRLQILNLLLSTYDMAVQANKELRQTSEALQNLNQELERQVAERTRNLTEEIAQRAAAEDSLRRTHHLTKLVEFAASTANENLDLDDACRRIITHVCDMTGWPTGRLYRRDHANGRSGPASDIWHLSERRGAVSWTTADQTQGGAREAALAEALSTGSANWRTVHLSEGEADSVEIFSMLTAPILVRNEAVGALQLFQQGKAQEDEMLMQAIGQVGLHLGRLIERHANTLALQEREAFLQGILDSGNSLVFVKDHLGRYLSCNRRFEELVGMRRDEVRGKTDADFFPPEIAKRWRADDLHVVMTQRTLTMEEEIPVGDEVRSFHSTRFPLYDGAGNAYAVCCQSVDITERKRAEEERQMLFIAAEQSAAGHIMVARNGAITMVNAAVERICRVDRTLLKNVADLDLGEEESTGKTFQEIWLQVLHGRDGSLSTIFLKEFDDIGERVWQARISPVTLDDGQVSHYLIIVEDMSEQRRLEAQVRRRQRIESLGTMASGIAHDFNNILTAILGYTDLASTHLEDTQQVEEELGYVRKAGIRAQHLVQQILRFSRPSESEFVPTNVQVLIGEVLNLIQASLPASIEVRTSFDPRCGVVLADANQLHQVLMNLCTNAHQAMGRRSGVLEIVTEPFRVVAGTPEAKLDLQPGEYVRIAVSDSGHGMDRETMEKIFDPFFTTKAPKGGTGLGLSVVHRVVRDHRGAITVYSEPGRGTTFHVYLPVASEQETQQPYLQGESQPGGSEHIIVVDDEPIIAELMRRKLSIMGYQVTAFTSPLQCLEALREKADGVDLVISDATMPHLQGAQLAEEIGKLNPDIPVILITGYRDHRDGEGVKNIKASLVKPVSTPDLAFNVRKVLDEQR